MSEEIPLGGPAELADLIMCAGTLGLRIPKVWTLRLAGDILTASPRFTSRILTGAVPEADGIYTQRRNSEPE
jgi:hypothetical protein